MFFVRRPFKSLGVYYGVGTAIVDPNSIKLFKMKVSDKHIVDVTETTFPLYQKYFLGKFGVDITGSFKGKEVKVKKPEFESEFELKAKVLKAKENKK